MTTKCKCCNCELSGGLDTYGDVGDELCQPCWLGLCYEAEHYTNSLDWYGLAPHHHDLSKTGSMIGSTVFDPLPDEKDGEGWYIIKPGLFFLPDDETGGGMGLWRDTRSVIPDYKSEDTTS